MKEDKSVRTFLAIALPPDIRDLIKDIQEKLKPVLKGIRWVGPEGMHLTLKFFGDVVQGDIVRISDVVTRRVVNSTPMELSIGSPGGFPSLKKPRVLWIGIGGDTQRLAVLQETIENDLEKCGFPREKRSFTPHLTLGRAVSRNGVIPGGEDVFGKTVKSDTGRFDVRELILFESELRPGGAVYKKLAGFPLGRYRIRD